ncbi:MAG TPA: hypothetical protein VF263_15320, partial [Longimicrobiaceae bacterium]
MTRRSAALACALALLAPRALAAQSPVRPHLEWRTVRTEHFDLHYPAELAEWTAELAGRMEGVHAAVSRLVGSAPRERITVIAEDPSGQANGSAISVLSGPVIHVWPTPPDPRSVLGNNRGAAEQLMVHEYAHVAHLTRPSRNPRDESRRFFMISPRGPLGRKTPRWVREGYATYVEGKLTGSGRPYGVYRPTVLRQWALEGKLPTYAQLSASSGFQGGAMAYLAGSAFLEWLVEKRGEESLVHLWRRLSARQPRTFEDAFAGVYGDAPADLYDRFTVEVTGRALEARLALARGGIVAGDTVQRLRGGTADPALSPDGRHLAVVLRAGGDGPGRVVVWRTAEEAGDSAEARARARLLARDPEDVPPSRAYPRPRRAVATLLPVRGRGHDEPRFLPGGEEILVTRQEPLGDGAFRPDLFAWSWRRGTVRRITRGASVRDADPSPDGRSAAAVQCLGGVCSLARVDLATGAVATLARGAPNTVFHRPRWSPDGSWIAVSVQERGRWRLARVDPATGSRAYLDPEDGASRYEPAFLPGGAELVAVSERGGVANLEVLDPETGAVRPLTRVTGAAVAPAPDPATGSVYFLSLHAQGYDLGRVHPDSLELGEAVPLPARLAPAAPRVPAAPADTFARAVVPPSRPYGAGPRGYRVLPQAWGDADGFGGGVALLSQDPVGRLTWLAQGAYGERDSWRGGSLRATWRGWRPALGAEAFAVRQAPSAGADLAGGLLDAEYAGAALSAVHSRQGSTLTQRAGAGASLGRLELAAGRWEAPEGGGLARALAWADYSVSGLRAGLLNGGVGVHGSVGRTGDETWWRGT